MTILEMLCGAYREEHTSLDSPELRGEASEYRVQLEALLGEEGFSLMDKYEDLSLLQMEHYFQQGFSAGFRTAFLLLGECLL